MFVRSELSSRQKLPMEGREGIKKGKNVREPFDIGLKENRRGESKELELNKRRKKLKEGGNATTVTSDHNKSKGQRREREVKNVSHFRQKEIPRKALKVVHKAPNK